MALLSSFFISSLVSGAAFYSARSGIYSSSFIGASSSFLGASSFGLGGGRLNMASVSFLTRVNVDMI